jgi:hypothetical protein
MNRTDQTEATNRPAARATTGRRWPLVVGKSGHHTNDCDLRLCDRRRAHGGWCRSRMSTTSSTHTATTRSAAGTPS